MDKKTISINPKLFEVGDKRKKSEKKKPHCIIKPNTLKKQLIQRIKHHKKDRSDRHKDEKERDEERDKDKDVKEIKSSDGEFNNAMRDLSDIVKNRKKTMKSPKMPPTGIPPLLQQNPQATDCTNKSPLIHINLPNSLDTKHNYSAATVSLDNNAIITKSTTNTTPPYGCLKNGQKPTYKTWKNTHNTHNTHNAKTVDAGNKITIVDTNPMQDDQTNIGRFTYRQKRLEEIKKKLKTKENQKQKLIPGHIPKKIKRTIKNVYTLGKKGKSVKVLIKNSITRKNNQIEKNIIEQTDLKDMKLYLKNQGLIASGSSAPTDVMREIFVSSKLTGDVENKNSDVLIKNYLATDS